VYVQRTAHSRAEHRAQSTEQIVHGITQYKKQHPANSTQHTAHTFSCGGTDSAISANPPTYTAPPSNPTPKQGTSNAQSYLYGYGVRVWG
jgi:hypothetical protein